MPFRSVGLLILEKPLPLFNGRPNRFILSNGKHPCSLLGDLAFEWKRGWRLPCFDADRLTTAWFSQQKQWGLYQNEVTSSLAAIQRPGHWADSCKLTNWSLSSHFWCFPQNCVFIDLNAKWPHCYETHTVAALTSLYWARVFEIQCLSKQITIRLNVIPAMLDDHRILISFVVLVMHHCRQGGLQTTYSPLRVAFTTPEKCENEASFLRLSLPSTLIRHENAALFVRLGLPPTLIRHENGALRKRSSKPRI